MSLRATNEVKYIPGTIFFEYPYGTGLLPINSIPSFDSLEITIGGLHLRNAALSLLIISSLTSRVSGILKWEVRNWEIENRNVKLENEIYIKKVLLNEQSEFSSSHHRI